MVMSILTIQHSMVLDQWLNRKPLKFSPQSTYMIKFPQPINNLNSTIEHFLQSRLWIVTQRGPPDRHSKVEMRKYKRLYNHFSVLLQVNSSDDNQSSTSNMPCSCKELKCEKANEDHYQLQHPLSDRGTIQNNWWSLRRSLRPKVWTTLQMIS